MCGRSSERLHQFPRRHRAERVIPSIAAPSSLSSLPHLFFPSPLILVFLVLFPPLQTIASPLLPILLMSLIAHILLLRRVLFFFYCPVMHEPLAVAAPLPHGSTFRVVKRRAISVYEPRGVREEFQLLTDISFSCGGQLRQSKVTQ